MRKYILLLIATALTMPLKAGDIVRVGATYEYVSNNPRETPEQALDIAFERARQQALIDRFGLDVSSVSETLVRNVTGGDEAYSSTDVFSIGGSAVRGEWIETEKEEVLLQVFENGFWRVKVSVRGKARNKSAAKAEISYSLVNNSHDRECRTSYYDGDDIFLKFSSPVDGTLCAYLVDEDQNAFCLLPYQGASAGCQAIKAGKEYLFFSSQEDAAADEYTLNCSRSSERNAVYLIFSPNSFSKASDKASGKNWREEQMPRSLAYRDFLKWLEKNQVRDPEMVVVREIITISK
ncbi:MAG: DUF4384 domain-containing protein [Candidatus Cryptobacteroides sp.]